MSASPVVTLLGRPGCHLCELAREALLALARDPAGGFELHELDIESDERLLRRHLERIPVVEVDGVVVSELEADPEALREALAHTVGPGPAPPPARDPEMRPTR